MNVDQITNIAIKIQQLGDKADFTLLVAIIGAIAAIAAAIVAGIFAYKVNQSNTQHQKQWAYINKRSLLIDHAVDTVIKMMYTKLLICDHNSQPAKDNFFSLQKDALLIESHLIVYGAQKIAEALNDIKTDIVQCPDKEFRNQWASIYSKGTGYLDQCRQFLGNDLGKDYTKFSKELTASPPPAVEFVPKTVTANTASSLSIQQIEKWHKSGT